MCCWDPSALQKLSDGGTSGPAVPRQKQNLSVSHVPSAVWVRELEVVLVGCVCVYVRADLGRKGEWLRAQRPPPEEALDALRHHPL